MIMTGSTWCIKTIHAYIFRERSRIPSWCSKNGVDKSFFLKSTNNVTNPFSICIYIQKKSSVFSQGLRIKRLCSDAISLTNYLKDLKSWFCNRGYPESMDKEQLRRVENRTRDELLCTNSCVGKGVGVSIDCYLLSTP